MIRFWREVKECFPIYWWYSGFVISTNPQSTGMSAQRHVFGCFLVQNASHLKQSDIQLIWKLIFNGVILSKYLITDALSISGHLRDVVTLQGVRVGAKGWSCGISICNYIGYISPRVHSVSRYDDIKENVKYIWKKQVVHMTACAIGVGHCIPYHLCRINNSNSTARYLLSVCVCFIPLIK